MCGSRKYAFPPQGCSLEILRVGGGDLKKPKMLKGEYEAKLEFLEVQRVQTKKQCVQEVWIFSGTTQC